MSDKAKIKVQQVGRLTNAWRVWLNDEEITDQCLSCTVFFKSGDLTITHLELLVSEVNAPEENPNEWVCACGAVNTENQQCFSCDREHT